MAIRVHKIFDMDTSSAQSTPSQHALFFLCEKNSVHWDVLNKWVKLKGAWEDANKWTLKLVGGDDTDQNVCE